MDAADAQYKSQQKKTIQTHAEYYESHLPKVLKVKKESVDHLSFSDIFSINRI